MASNKFLKQIGSTVIAAIILSVLAGGVKMYTNINDLKKDFIFMKDTLTTTIIEMQKEMEDIKAHVLKTVVTGDDMIEYTEAFNRWRELVADPNSKEEDKKYWRNRVHDYHTKFRPVRGIGAYFDVDGKSEPIYNDVIAIQNSIK